MLLLLGATKYGVALSAGTRIAAPVIKRGAADFALSADWTPAAGDVTVSKDGGTAANIATLPVALTMGNGGLWLFAFSATELECKRLYINVCDAATKAVEDQCYVLETYGHANALYPSDPSANNIDQETRFLAAAKGIVYGTVGNSGTNTQTKIYITGGSGACDPAPTAADQFKGRILIFGKSTLTGALQGQGFPISGNTTTDISCDAGNALTVAPQNGDIFTIT